MMKRIATGVLATLSMWAVVIILVAITADPSKAQAMTLKQLSDWSMSVDRQLTLAGKIINDQTVQINKLTDSHRSLLAAHNTMLNYLLIQACGHAQIVEPWNAYLPDSVKIRKFDIGDHGCPGDRVLVVPDFVEPMD